MNPSKYVLLLTLMLPVVSARADRAGRGVGDDPLAYDLVVVDGVPVVQITEEKIKEIVTQVQLIQLEFKNPDPEFYSTLSQMDQNHLAAVSDRFSRKIEDFSSSLAKLRKDAATGLGKLALRETMPDYQDARAQAIRHEFKDRAQNLKESLERNYYSLGGNLIPGIDIHRQEVQFCQSPKCVELVTEAYLDWLGVAQLFGKQKLGINQLIGKNGVTFALKPTSVLVRRAYSQWIGDTFPEEKDSAYYASKALQVFFLSGIELSQDLIDEAKKNWGNWVVNERTYANIFSEIKRPYAGDVMFPIANGVLSLLRSNDLELFVIPFAMLVDVAFSPVNGVRLIHTRLKDYLEPNLMELQAQIVEQDAAAIVNKVEKEFDRIN